MFALALFPAIASAQTREIKEEGKTVFKPHAYLQLQGGAAHTLGEVSFTDLISPAAAINLGYKFTPVFGARIGASGWQAKGAWVAPKQVYDFNYLQGNIDITLDIFSLFGGFNPMRIVNPYLFAGGGFAYGFNNDGGANNLNTGGYQLEYLWKDNKTFIAGRGGLGIDFRLNNVVSLGLEGNVNVLPDKFNSKKQIIRTGSSMPWQVSKSTWERLTQEQSLSTTNLSRLQNPLQLRLPYQNRNRSQHLHL